VPVPVPVLVCSLVPVIYVYFIRACHLIGNATPLQRGDS